jgi:signal transduction histidine kinase/DNA-binding NarL/FixJ family response regulator/ligand-binding sensor domain-containing protein
MKRSIILIVAILISALAEVFADAPVYRRLNMTNGLFNNQARMVTAMPDGRILVFTDGMFNIYNGARFEQMECNLSRSFSIRSFVDLNQYAIQSDLLWVKDYYYLYLINMRSRQFVYDVAQRFAASGIRRPIQRLFFDQEGAVWLVSDEGSLYRYDWVHKAQCIWQPIKTMTSGQQKVNVIGVCQNSPFHCIFFSDGTLRFWNQNSKQWAFSDNSLKSAARGERVVAIPWDNRTIVFALEENNERIIVYDIYTHNWRLIPLQGKEVTSLHRFGNKLYLTNNSGLFIYDKNFKISSAQTKFNLNDGTTLSDQIMDVLVDRQGGTWLCTFSQGMLYTHPRMMVAKTYSFSGHDAEHNHVRCLMPYDNNQLLVGTGKGIYLFNVNTHIYSSLGNSTNEVLCFNFSRDSSGTIWASTNEGLFCIKSTGTKLFNSSNVAGMKSNLVRDCKEVSRGVYLVCNNLNQVGYFYPQKNRFEALNANQPLMSTYRTVSNILLIPKMNLASVSTQNGLYLYDLKRNQIIAKPQFNVRSNKYNCQMTDEGQRLWLGTQNGLLLCNLKNGKIRCFTTSDGLPSNCVQSILKNNKGEYWVSTSNGVAKFCINGDNAQPAVVAFGVSDGVQCGELAERAVVKMSNGIYYGGIDGITVLDRNLIAPTHTHLHPLLINLQVFGKDIAANGFYQGHRVLYEDTKNHATTIKLSHDENFITILFSALNYINPQHTVYRYRLEGVDKLWNVTKSADGMGTASYTSLSPGNYQFVVQAKLDGESWGETMKIQIEVLPPFWATWWAYLIYFVLAATIVFVVLHFYLEGQKDKLRIEQEHEKRLEEKRLDELKFRFFTNISHEFRTPLTLILTPLELLMKKMKGRTEYVELERIHHNAMELLQLVNQLLDFRRLERNGEQLNLQPVHIRAFTESCYAAFRHYAEDKNILFKLQCPIENDENFMIDADKMKKVLFNLLSNAFKFTADGGTVVLSANINSLGLNISVSDTGVGISASDIPFIFNRFYQSENDNMQSGQLNTGSGIGLHLVKGYVSLHGGQVEVKSKVGEGSTFSIFIPYNKNKTIESLPDKSSEEQNTSENLSQQDVENVDSVEDVESASSTGNNSKVDNTETTHDMKKLRILIVEDSKEFREFLGEILSHAYQVVLASDGVEGLDLVHASLPDLVISDVMMPRMDGCELCRNLKNDLKYSHIPVVLLTAKDSEEGQVNAYESGADSYITKPFSVDVLLARIKQLIAQMEKRKQIFNRSVSIDPKEIAVTSLDEQLIRKALDCMERHIGDTAYSVERLSQDIGMDRTNLYRKIQAILGQTPSEFMRSVRLKRAAQLLRDSDFSVSQISSMVGFNTSRYFSQYFREMFGVTPNEYTHKKSDLEDASKE